MNFLSPVPDVPPPTPVSTSDRCYVPHCLLVPWRCSVKVWPVLSLKLLLNQACFLVIVRMRKWLIYAIWSCEALDCKSTSHPPHQISLCPLLESDSARSNSQPNIKAQTRDYKLNHRKKGMSIWPVRLSVKVVSTLMSWFSPSFSDALVNPSALTLLLESFARKSDSVAGF